MSAPAAPGRKPAVLGPGRRLLWSIPLGWQLSALYIMLLIVTLTLVGVSVYKNQESFLVTDAAAQLDNAANRTLARPEYTNDKGRSAPPGRLGDGDLPAASNTQGANQGPAHQGRPNNPPPTAAEQSLALASLLVGDLTIRGTSGADVTVVVLNSTGHVISTTQGLDGAAAPSIDPVTPQQIAAVLTGNQPLHWVVPGTDGNQHIVHLKPITVPLSPNTPNGSSARITLILEQSASLTRATNALRQLGTFLLLGVLGGSLAGVVLGLAFTRAVLRPLDQVADTADAIAGGDLQRRLQLPPGRNEVARLGKAFDYMVGRLVTTLEAQRRFVADASHELRTPLTSLKGLAEILVIGAHGNDRRVIEQAAGAINSELERLNRLVNDLLTLSRLDSADGNAAPPVRRVRMDACATLHAAADQMGALAEGREVRLNRECAGPLWVTGDAGQLKQVLLNLIDNALRYTPPGGEVTLRGRVDGATARMEVQDTGVGIAPEDLAHIFERFYRGDASRTRATGNSGLGLAIVQTIVHAHGGEITVQSAPGAGTCFTITLPLSTGPAARPEAPVSTEAGR